MKYKYEITFCAIEKNDSSVQNLGREETLESKTILHPKEIRRILEDDYTHIQGVKIINQYIDGVKVQTKTKLPFSVY